MGISSVGVGSGILTQDLLDKLRAADEGGQIRPIDFRIALEKDKQAAFEIVDANMENLIDSINEIKNASLYDEREVTTSSSAVEVTAQPNSDVQDFSLEVTQLATKQIEESGAFTSATETIANGAGSLNLNIDGEDFTIDYDATTSLTDLKDLINSQAGDKVNATVVQINSGEFRLFVSSADTGTTQDITITDNSAQLKDTRLTTGLTAIQTGVDANFSFNGQAITRTSNDVSDLIVGLTISLKEVGTASVSVSQNREDIMSRFDSFVEKYNATITELDKMTKASKESDEKGIFSTESTIKGMKNVIKGLLTNLTSPVGTMLDYGFDIDKDGVMTLDKTVLNEQLDSSASNTQAFFSGGDFDNGDGTTTTLEGAFSTFSTSIEAYTKYDATLDQLEKSISASLSSLEERKQKTIDSLDSKYGILQKQFIANDLIISRLNNASNMFVQLANAQIAGQNG